MRDRHDLAELVFRVSFSAVFVAAGLKHLIRPQEIAARLLDAPLAHLATSVAPAALLVAITGAVLLLGGVALLFGVGTNRAALVLLAVLVPITIAVHVGSRETLGPLFKNVALAGGLIHFAAAGSGRSREVPPC